MAAGLSAGSSLRINAGYFLGRQHGTHPKRKMDVGIGIQLLDWRGVGDHSSTLGLFCATQSNNRVVKTSAFSMFCAVVLSFRYGAPADLRPFAFGSLTASTHSLFSSINCALE